MMERWIYTNSLQENYIKTTEHESDGDTKFNCTWNNPDGFVEG